MSDDVVIIGGARTPFCEWVGGKRGDGKPGGLLKDYSALKLGEIAIKGALEKTNTSPEDVDHVVMGYALQTCGQAIFGARHAGLGAGIPQEVPMLTVSRICGSGFGPAGEGFFRLSAFGHRENVEAAVSSIAENLVI